MVVLDGDTPGIAKQVQAARDAGAIVLQWSIGSALEDVVAAGLDEVGLQALVDAAVSEIESASVLSGLCHWLASPPHDTDVSAMIRDNDLSAVRTAIASAAKGKGTDGSKKETKAWFKREDRGERLAEVIWSHRSTIVDTELGRGLQQIRAFAYAGLATDIDHTPD